MPKLKPKPVPTPSFKDAPKQYRAFAYLVHICNWTRTEAYTSCFPNSKSVGQSLNNVASSFGRRDDIQAIFEGIDLYEVRDFINAKIALMEKNDNSFAFAKQKPMATTDPLGEGEDMLSMSDEELMNQAVILYRSAPDDDKRLQALKLITDLKKKLGTGGENEDAENVTKYYIPISCKGCGLYEAKKVLLQAADNQ